MTTLKTTAQLRAEYERLVAAGILKGHFREVTRNAIETLEQVERIERAARPLAQSILSTGPL